MANYNFNLRDANSKSETPIHLVVRWNGNRLVYPTGEKIKPKYWDIQNQIAIKKGFPEYSEFNSRLNNILVDAKNVFRRYQNDHKHEVPTLVKLRELFNIEFKKQTNEKQKNLFWFIEKFISDAKLRFNEKTQKLTSVNTIRDYKRCYEVLKEFGQKKKINIDFETIDLDFYVEYKRYLTDKLNFSQNTIGKHIKTLKTFLNDAKEQGYNKHLKYQSKNFKVPKEDTESIYLNENEIEQIYNLDLSHNERLEKVRDLFIVGCWTGLRFSDFTNIQKSDIQGKNINIKTQKTNEKVSIPIHRNVISIMKKYEGKYPNSLPPSISNQNMNLYLKEIGKLIKDFHENISITSTKGGKTITKTYKKYELLTTHTARRSMASNLFKDELPSITIMKITGHKSEKSFLKYIKLTPEEHAKIIQLNWQKKDKLKAI